MPIASSPNRRADPGTPGFRNRARFMVELFSDTIDRFSENEGFRLVAAFSYYATFSIFPLILLAVTVIGFIVGDSGPAREQMLDAVSSAASPARNVLELTLASMQKSHEARGISAAIAIGTLLFAASGAFVELDAALNRIWCVPKRTSDGKFGWLRVLVLERLTSIAIVAGIALLLLISLISSSLLAHVAHRASEELEIPLWPGFLRAAELSLSIALLSLAFALAFHLIPRSHPPIATLVGGSVFTTVLLVALKELFASYLSRLTSYSAYGVVGGVLALLTWIYLSSLIALFGAQLTRVNAEKHGVVGECDQLRSGCATELENKIPARYPERA